MYRHTDINISEKIIDDIFKINLKKLVRGNVPLLYKLIMLYLHIM